MLYIVFALAIGLAILFVASDSSFSRSRKSQWWHFRPSASLIVGGLIGIFVAELTPAITHNADEQIWAMCRPIVGFVLGTVFGLMVDDLIRKKRK